MELAGLLDRLLADDRDAYLVLADALQRAGDPRGELSAIDLRREDDPDDEALDVARAALLDAHPEWWGTLWDVISLSLDFAVMWRRGFVHAVMFRRLARAHRRSASCPTTI